MFDTIHGCVFFSAVGIQHSVQHLIIVWKFKLYLIASDKHLLCIAASERFFFLEAATENCHDPRIYCLIFCFILKPCPFVPLIAFQFLHCVFSSQCFSVHYLTFPSPSLLTSPVPVPFVSVSVYLVFVVPHVFLSLFWFSMMFPCYSTLVHLPHVANWHSAPVSLQWFLFSPILVCFWFCLSFD